MDYFSHLIAGFLVGGLILFYFNSLSVQPVVFIGLCAILPDIDHPKSKITKLLYFLVFVLSFLFIQPIIQKYFSFALSIVLTFLLSIFIIIAWLAVKPKHRGLTHSIAFAVLFMLIAVYFEGLVVGFSGFASYVSHILLDKI